MPNASLRQTDLIALSTVFHGAISRAVDPPAWKPWQPQLHAPAAQRAEALRPYKGSVKGKLIRCLRRIYQTVCHRFGGARPSSAPARRTYVMQNASTSPRSGDYGVDLPVLPFDLSACKTHCPISPNVAQLGSALGTGPINAAA